MTKDAEYLSPEWWKTIAAKQWDEAMRWVKKHREAAYLRAKGRR